MTPTVSTWSPAAQGAAEHFIIAQAGGRQPFAVQLSRTFELYQAELDRLGLDGATGCTATIFLSDSANQEDEVRSHAGFARLIAAGLAVTVIQQPPAKGKIALLAYHVVRSAGGFTRTVLAVAGARPKAMGLAVATGAYTFLYLRNLLSRRGGSAFEQTEALLGNPGFGGQSNDIVLSEVVRTWLYISTIDSHYAGVSTARNRLFERYGITGERGFPASTGIDGRSAEAGDLLLLDLLAIKGLRPGQNRRMEAITHMNPTVDYGVTFERGREVVFGDRRHLFVSGTASISNRGEILFLGDVVRQTARAIENVEALLAASVAKLEDLRYLVVYLRDASDADAVEKVLTDSLLSGVPRILVHAPVCRPGWLVEMEGVAIDGKGDPRFAAF